MSTVHTLRADFNADRTRRYLLSEVWDASRPVLPWVLFNPSVAGQPGAQGVRADPTWRKGRGFSQRLGYGGMVFANLFSLVSTDPKAVRAAGYPVEPGEDDWILRACRMGTGGVVCAWGNLARGLVRPSLVAGMIHRAGFTPMCLGTNADGSPKHPLMLGYGTPLVKW